MMQEYSDDECFVCLDLMWYPCRTPCGHYICLECLDSLLEYNRSCPLCRTPFKASFEPKIDEGRQKEIKKVQQEGFVKRAQEIQSQGLVCNSLKILYGNTHKLINGRQNSNTHSWVAFLRLSDSYLDISKYIKEVVFILHPTFKNPRRTITSAPFKIACYGWGEFNIPIIIHWQPWLEEEPTKLSHCISFEGSGDSVETTIFFDRSIYLDIEEKDQNKKPNLEPIAAVDTLALVYGNTFNKVDDKNFLWNVSVELKEDHLDISKYVEKVVFNLPLTFQDQTIQVEKAPFIASFVGEEDFRLCIFVHWKPWLEIEPTKLTHFVSEEDSNEYFINTVHCNKNIFPVQEDMKEESNLEDMHSENTLAILYGNNHQLIPNLDSNNNHAWCVFVKLENQSADITEYVKKVVFNLHSSYVNPVREVTEAPFQVKCIGWGQFRIPITIHWQDWLEMNPTTVNHDINFEDDEEIHRKLVKFG